MNCPVCGKELKPTQKFCPACGTKLAQEVEQPPQDFEKTWQPQTEVEEAFEQPAAAADVIAQAPEGYENTWQPQTDYPEAEPQFEQPEQGGFPEEQPMPEPEALGAQEAFSEPPKKKVSIVTIIVIAGAAVLLVAGGVFFAFKLGLFGGDKDDKGSSETSQSSQVSQSSSSPEELVQKFEKALDDNDEEAMKELFAPDKRDVQAKGAFTMVSAISSAAQNFGVTVDYTCELNDLKYDESNESAKGGMKIAISPLPGLTTKVSFVKVDGVWYIDNLLQ